MVRNLIVDMPVTNAGPIFTFASIQVFKNLFLLGTNELLSCTISDGERSCENINEATVERGNRIVVFLRSQDTLATYAEISMEFS